MCSTSTEPFMRMVLTMIYFDYAATCPLGKEAGEAYIKAASEYFGNSSSLHDIGDTANSLLENCRTEIAKMLGVQADGLFFTSGGTESNYLGIQALLSSKHKTGKHIISGIAEHSSIGGTLDKLEKEGYEVTQLGLNNEGIIDLSELEQAIKEDTVLAIFQHGNSEIGTIQPIRKIHSILSKNKILFHSDCVHTFGKIDLKEISPFVDSIALSGHKIYGPKGVGVLYVSPSIAWKPYYHGVTHEKGVRPGTVNVPAVVSMTVAAQQFEKKREIFASHYKNLRNTLLHGLEEVAQHLIVYNFDDCHQLPSTVGLRVKGLEGQWVMLECNRYGYALSTGSACQVGKQSPSKAMKALGVMEKEAKEFIRISFGIETTVEEVQQLASTIVTIIKSVK